MKKTFIGILTVLTVCLLVCAMVVSCGKKDREITVGPDGYLYIDGEKTDIKAEGNEGAETPCNHQMVQYEIKPHTATSDGEILEVCSKCHSNTSIKRGSIHDLVKVVSKEATCLEDGEALEICSICDKELGTSVISKLGHQWSEDIVLSNEDECACCDGIVSVKMCSVCLVFDDPKTSDPLGHTSEEWTVTTAPTLADAGKAEGVCVYCDADIYFVLPALNDGEDGAYDGVWCREVLDEEGTLGEELKASCSNEGLKNFTYVPSGEIDENNVSDANIAFSADVVIPRTDHSLNGKYVSEWLENGNYSYYTDIDGDGELDVVGFVELYLNGIACETAGIGYYVCDDCGKSYYLENIYKSHYGSESVSVEALCHTPGTKVLACENCDKEIESEYYVDHEYVYELVDDNDGNDSTWNLVGKCKAAKAILDSEGNEVGSIECWEQTEGIIGMVVESVVAEKINTTAATCYMPGYDVWGYESLEAWVAVDSDEDGVADLLPHTLDGKTLDQYDVITFDIPGVTVRGDIIVDKCYVEYPAQFQCSVCAAYKAESGANIQTIIEVNAIRTHSKAYDDSRSWDATCTVDGGKMFICKYFGCELASFNPNNTDEAYKAKYIEIIPAAGHDIECAHTVDLENNKFTVTCKCKNESCDLEVTKEALIKDFAFKEEKLPKDKCTDAQIYAYEAIIAVEIADNGEVILKNADADSKNTFSVYYVIVNEICDSHDFCTEDFYQVVEFEKDLDGDGKADVVDKYVLKHCVECLHVEIASQERVEIER